MIALKSIICSSLLLTLAVALEGCKPAKNLPADATKKVEAADEEKVSLDAEPEEEIAELPSEFLSLWTRCDAANGSTVVKYLKRDIYFVDSETVKTVEKMVTDSSCAKELTSKELAALFKESNPDVKATKAATDRFNQLIKRGTIYSGNYAPKKGSTTEGTLDVTTSDGNTAFQSYKITDTVLSLAVVCLNEENCKKIIGDSEETRSTDFTNSEDYKKVVNGVVAAGPMTAGNTAGTAVVANPATGASGTTGTLAGTVWSVCNALASGTAKGVLREFTFIDGKTVGLVTRMMPEGTCKTEFTSAQYAALYKESNPNKTPIASEQIAFNAAMLLGQVSNGTYALATGSTTQGTFELVDAGVKTYRSFKIEGTKLSLTSYCTADDVNAKTCPAVSGLTEATRSKDFSNADVLTKK